MNKNRFSVLLKVVLIVAALFIIIGFVSGKFSNQTEKTKEQNFSNVYITNTGDGKISFLIDEKEETFKISETKENLTGKLADITVKKDSIIKLRLKENTIHGKLLGITDNSIILEGYGEVSLTEGFKSYKSYSGIEKIDAGRILVGYDVTNFFVENDKICGAVVYKNVDADIIRVLINTTNYAGKFHENVVVSSEKDYKLSYGDKETVVKGGKDTKITVKSKYLKKGDLKIQPIDDKKKITLKNVERSYGNPQYEGSIYISKRSDGLLVVNELELERYLYSVVPSEMPSSYGIKALEVQAVCARTYAYRQMLNNSYGKFGAHVDDSVAFQVYNNVKATENAVKAVDNTYGKIISQNGNPIEAYFFSTSCGSTTDLSSWCSKNEPYIKGRVLSADSNDINLTNNKTFAKFIKSDYEAFDCEYPYYRWNITLTRDEVGELMENWEKDIGTVKSIKINERGTGGVINAMTIIGSKDSILITGELNIRKAFNIFGKELNLNNDTVNTTSKILPSAFFTVDSKSKKFILSGGGYGHGIGMSQNAVKGMLESGMSLEEVICFFYYDVEIQEIYN